MSGELVRMVKSNLQGECVEEEDPSAIVRHRLVVARALSIWVGTS